MTALIRMINRTKTSQAHPKAYSAHQTQPGLPAAGEVIEEPVLNIDFLPSMLALAGIAVPDHVQGMSFSSLLQGKPPADWAFRQAAPLAGSPA